MYKQTAESTVRGCDRDSKFNQKQLGNWRGQEEPKTNLLDYIHDKDLRILIHISKTI